jgi:hypothetical protein
MRAKWMRSKRALAHRRDLQASQYAGIGYWSPEDMPSSQNRFIYILQHPSREDAEKNWAAFKADPEWQKVKAQTEANGPLVDQEDSYFMDPTSYSALQ